MNTKELAKLLLKHPLIKKINESQMWDRSIVSRVIAEELLNEQDKIQARIDRLEKRITMIQADVETNRTLQGGAATQKEKDNYAKKIETGNSRIDTIQKEIEKLEAKQNAASAQKEPAKEVPAPAPRETTPAEKELSRDKLISQIGELESTISVFKDSGVPTDEVEAKLSAAQEKLKAIDKTSKVVTDKAIESNKPEVKKFAKALNQDTTEKVAQANKKIEAAKESPPKVKTSEIEKAVEEIPTEPLKKATEKIVKSKPQPEPEEPKQLPSKGWVNPFLSLKRQIAKKAQSSKNPQTFFNEVLDSLAKNDQKSFFELVAPSAKQKDAKFQQALEVIESVGVTEEFQSIIDSFKKEESEVAVDQVMTYLGFLQEFSKIKGETERFRELVKGLTKQVSEKPEAPVEQTAKDFLQTIEKEKGIAISDQPSEEDRIKREKYVQIAESMLSVVESLKSNELLKNDLVKMFVGWWLTYNTDQTLQEGMVTDEVGPFREQNKLTNKEVKNLQQLFMKNKTSFEKLMDDLKSIITPQSEEQKDQTRQYLVPLSKTEMPKEILFKIAKEAGAEEEILKNLKIPSQKDQVEDEEGTKLLTGPVQEEEAQEEAQEDIQPERETPPQVFSEQHYTTLATFFADEGARGLGFMQQLLLRRQSEQLYGLIETLNELIDPTGGEEAALTREVLGEQQEENTTEQGMELEPSEKRKLKSELLGLLSALRSLKTLSKAYEENLTRTSVDPRYDGSSLKKRLDAMLPDIQDSIARILKMIKDFLAELPKVEPMGSEEVVQEQEGKGLDREAKIDLVDDTYKEMRKMWPVLKSALQDQTEEPEEENIEEQEDASRATETVVSTARKMRELASSKPFIDFFPTITFSQEGQVVSINQANNVLSGVISQFVYVMRNVVALVKGEELTEGTAIEVQDKLVSISNAIEKSFGVPASKVVRQVEKEISEKPSERSLTETPANNNEFVSDDASTVDPEAAPELDDEKDTGEEDAAIPTDTDVEDAGEEPEEGTPEAEEKPEEGTPKPEGGEDEDEGEEIDFEDYAMDWYEIAKELDLSVNPMDYLDPLEGMLEDDTLSENIKTAIRMNKATFSSRMNRLQEEFIEMVKILKSIEKHFEPTSRNTNENILKRMGGALSKVRAKKNLIKRVSKLKPRRNEKMYGKTIDGFKEDLKDLKLNFLVQEPLSGYDFWDKLQRTFFTQFNKQLARSNEDSIEETLREALKPIIAKMLKEHHG